MDAVCHCFWECRPGATVVRDTHAAATSRWPMPSVQGCSRFACPLLAFVCQCFPSLVARQVLCRSTSESTSVAGLSPCSTCLVGLPGRVSTVRLNVLLRQVSLNSPPNRPYPFQGRQLSRFPFAFSSRSTFLRVAHHDTRHKVSWFSDDAESSGVPMILSL